MTEKKKKLVHTEQKDDNVGVYMNEYVITY